MVSVRPATPDDAATILTLVRELADYERAPDAVVATEASFRQHGFGERSMFQALMADRDGKVAGFALYFFGFSTWTGTPVLHLEDSFVRPEQRKTGVGLALMKALAREAVARGCGRFAWQVLDWNEPAIRFYESLGATLLPEWRTVRIDGPSLAGLAAT